MTEPLNQTSVHAAFARHFNKPARLFRAPARINIIGEHTDYSDGFVLPANADLHTWLAIAPRSDKVVRMYTCNFDEWLELSLDDLKPCPGSGWQEYPKAVCDVLQHEGFALTGADMLVAGEVPLRSGLSSSAAIETVTGFAMLAIAACDIDRRRLALMCQQAEKEFVGLSCGIMDQFVISTCRRGHAMLLDCRTLDVQFAPLPDTARLLIVHSGVNRQLRERGYNDRRSESEAATAIIATQQPGVHALRDVNPADLNRHRTALGERLYRRAHHVVSENRRVWTAFDAMHAGDMATLGKVMTASHLSLRDDYEVSCDDVDTLVNIALDCDGVFGSRIVGGGFGGCTVTLVGADKAKHAAATICQQYQHAVGRTPWYHFLGPTSPVGEVTTA